MTSVKKWLTLFLLFLLAGFCLEKLWYLTVLSHGLQVVLIEGNPFIIAFEAVLMFVCAWMSIVLAVVYLVDWGIIKRERDE
jgi:hypothetical protein